MSGRAGRAAILAVAAVVLGIAAHGETGASGWAFAASPVSATLIAVITVATALVAVRPPSLPRVGLLLGGAQLALHLALMANTHTDDMAMVSDRPTADQPMIDLPMVLGHLLVTALVTAGVVGADRALLTAGHRVLGDLLAAVRFPGRCPLPVSTPSRASLRPHPAPARRPATVLITRSHPRRGPPPRQGAGPVPAPC